MATRVVAIFTLQRIMSMLKTVCKTVYLSLKILHIKKTILGFQ